MKRLTGGLGMHFPKPKKSSYVTVSEAVDEYHKSLKYDITKDKVLSKIVLWRGDITKLKVDAIVNAANSSLLGGGGVDGAIHSAAGRELLEECRKLDGCETGDAKMTKGYCLPAKFVIHTVGPRYHGKQSDKKDLSSCYRKSLDIMLKNSLKTVAFPCISTGIYGYPNEDAAQVALTTVRQWLFKHHDCVENIIFCLFLELDVNIYTEAVDELYQQSIKDVDCTTDDPAARKVVGHCNNGNGTKDAVSYGDDYDEAGSQTMEDTKTAEQCNNTDKQECSADDEFDNSQNQQPEGLPKDCDDIDTNSPRTSKEETQLVELSPEEKEKWIEKFKSLEVESAVKPIFENTEEWLEETHFESLKLVGGLDISYHKTKSSVASVSLVVLSYPELELLYEDTTIESITAPYIPGYLAYREAEHFNTKIKRVKETKFSPQVILVDGNGALHPRRYGSAVKVGVDADLPTIGVAKNLMVMEEFGIHQAKIEEIKTGGGIADIASKDGEVFGKAVRTTDKSHKPVFVSVGHKCSLDSAVRIVLGCCRTRIPEPIRQADHRSKMKLKNVLPE